MKKIVFLVLAALMCCVCFAGCGNDGVNMPESAKTKSAFNLFTEYNSLGLKPSALHLKLDRSGYMEYQCEGLLSEKKDSILARTADRLKGTDGTTGVMDEADYQAGRRAVYMPEQYMIQLQVEQGDPECFTVRLYFRDINHLSMTSSSARIEVTTLEKYMTTTDLTVDQRHEFKYVKDNAQASLYAHIESPAPTDGNQPQSSESPKPLFQQRANVLVLKGLVNHIPVVIDDGALIMYYAADEQVSEAEKKVKGKNAIQFTNADATLVYAEKETAMWPLWTAVSLAGAFVVVLVVRLIVINARKKRA